MPEKEIIKVRVRDYKTEDIEVWDWGREEYGVRYGPNGTAFLNDKLVSWIFQWRWDAKKKEGYWIFDAEYEETGKPLSEEELYVLAKEITRFLEKEGNGWF